MSTGTAVRRSSSASQSAAGASSPRLRPHALGFPPLLAQSVAVISPTMTAVLIIALAFGDAGQGTWAAYLFGTIMLLFVVLGLNQFARRSATAGSMYAYTARGLGPAAGVLSGWSLIWSYWGIATAGLAGFAIFAQEFLSGIGVHGTVSPFVLFAISGAVCLTIAWKDIRVSSLLTLALEALSVTCILALAAVILFRHGLSVDTAQLKLQGVSLKGMDFAIVICIFSLVGFESATALGGEAKNPLRNVPRAVICSLLITGAFMVFMSYIEVFATHHMGVSLGSLSTPLTNIASAYSVPFFHVPVALGAMVSFFSLSLSCLNAGARIIFPLAGHGFLPERAHAVHHKNMTPHVALASYGAVILGIAFVLHATGTSPLTIFDDAGTLAAFGFLFAYFMITVAAPMYLRKLGELRGKHVLIAVAAFACLMVPTVGSFYPAPPWPVNLFPYLFLVFMLLGGARLYMMHRTQPGTLPMIQRGLELALAASAHEIAVSEEEHAHAHMPGERVRHPAPAAPAAGVPSGVGMVSASAIKRTE
ncbi:MAG TPA: APC family permease [Solirubrobacteraceae bacterium]|nr:APC family permease [Solirubrobacteraceae bacterium]